jgi:hypothetical protein
MRASTHESQVKRNIMHVTCAKTDFLRAKECGGKDWGEME